MPPKFKRHLDDSDYLRSKPLERRNLLGEYHDDPDDDTDFVPQSANRGNDNIKQVQGQVDEVVGIMQDNISKVIDRGDRLEDLQEKSEELTLNATHFKVSAKGLKKAMWWQACKMRLLLVCVVLVIVLVIIIPIIYKYAKQ
ncbi:vesicle-associated membrane protein 4-like [Ptychodera flava]|uniref:vesicle-associated membrane protein 4-like n=1 Tax=Ptychodera flava TaxID=63121 RepID=UPI003969CCAF